MKSSGYTVAYEVIANVILWLGLADYGHVVGDAPTRSQFQALWRKVRIRLAQGVGGRSERRQNQRSIHRAITGARSGPDRCRVLRKRHLREIGRASCRERV